MCCADSLLRLFESNLTISHYLNLGERAFTPSAEMLFPVKFKSISWGNLCKQLANACTPLSPNLFQDKLNWVSFANLEFWFI